PSVLVTEGNKTGNIAPGKGGDGWVPSSNDARWISDVTGVNEFSHGGDGGGQEFKDNKYTNVQGKDGVNFGDGGSAGNNGKENGASGHRGIVIIRFLHPSTGS
ncbi:MAG: hypothetical protein LBB47_04855, partial [Spirochaetaceae bacterium]|nr:hypothetical protein [Spirochaetaceae bacterium]